MSTSRTVSAHAAQQGLALEHPPLVLVVQGEQRAGGLADARQLELHAPDLALVAEAVLHKRYGIRLRDPITRDTGSDYGIQ